MAACIVKRDGRRLRRSGAGIRHRVARRGGADRGAYRPPRAHRAPDLRARQPRDRGRRPGDADCGAPEQHRAPDAAGNALPPRESGRAVPQARHDGRSDSLGAAAGRHRGRPEAPARPARHAAGPSGSSVAPGMDPPPRPRPAAHRGDPADGRAGAPPGSGCVDDPGCRGPRAGRPVGPGDVAWSAIPCRTGPRRSAGLARSRPGRGPGQLRRSRVAARL
jgi:hypothetical protein